MFLILTDEQKKKISDTAHSLIGVKYTFGAELTQNMTFPEIQKIGIDCSELVEYCFARAGVKVPDGAIFQFAKSEFIDENNIQVGDVIFKTKNNITSHVALIVEDNQLIEAEDWYGKVIKRSLTEFRKVKPTACQPTGIRRFVV